MKIEKISYSEFQSESREWILEEISLGMSNLIVGKNASGKSRTLNIINSLAKQLTGVLGVPLSGKYDCTLSNGNAQYRYEVSYTDQQVLTERLSINEELVLERGDGGIGKIKSSDTGGSLRFQAPQNLLAAATRRDGIQHPFLEPLYVWASSMRYYPFGSSLGKEHLAVFQGGAPEVDDSDSTKAVAVFVKGKNNFGEAYEARLIDYLQRVGYNVESITVGPPLTVRMDGGSQISCLHVKERDLRGNTDQLAMSQGMWRVVSLLIQVHYLALRNLGGCILIDDIGEGLDFDRSCRLIDLLRDITSEFNVQVVMATNDRFVMNKVPLEEWSVLQREGSRVKVYNHTNSKDQFEDFKFTGLSNFSFLEMDFIHSIHDEVSGA